MTLKSIKHNPFKVVEMFEEEVAEYTGAPHAIAVDSCTNAIFLCLTYWKQCNPCFEDKIIVPLYTYLSVPQMVLRAGFDMKFVNYPWSGDYELAPTNIIDSAKRLTSGMYRTGKNMCLSFHIKKHLPIGKGGMILTDDICLTKWAKRTRYEGRSECDYKDDTVTSLGYNMYMTPEQAARGLMLMLNYPEKVPVLDELEGYRDLSTFHIFDKYEVIR